MFGIFDYFRESYQSFRQMARLCWSGGDIVVYGRQRLSHPHRSSRKEKGRRAKAQRRAKTRRRRK